MGDIIPFLSGRPAIGRLLTRDKIEICRWETICEHPGICRVVLYEGINAGDQCDNDFVLVYGPVTSWARWGLTRGRAGVLLWECASGADLGVFATMSEALVELEEHADTTWRPRRIRRVAGHADDCLSSPAGA